jgi:hypothetical protein
MLPHINSGKAAPICVDPHPGGNIAIASDGRTYRMLKRDEDYAGDRYLNHFANCPHRTSYDPKQKPIQKGIDDDVAQDDRRGQSPTDPGGAQGAADVPARDSAVAGDAREQRLATDLPDVRTADAEPVEDHDDRAPRASALAPVRLGMIDIAGLPGGPPIGTLTGSQAVALSALIDRYIRGGAG